METMRFFLSAYLIDKADTKLQISYLLRDSPIDANMLGSWGDLALKRQKSWSGDLMGLVKLLFWSQSELGRRVCNSPGSIKATEP